MERFDDTILQAIPDPALLLCRGRLSACNRAAQALFPELEPGSDVPQALCIPPGGCGAASAGGRSWQITASQAGEHTLLLLRPAQDGGLRLLDGAIRCLREQMGSMMLSAQLLARAGERQDDSGLERRLAGMNHSLCRMLRLVNRLDLLRGMELEEDHFHPVTLDLAGLCREIMDAAGPLLAQTGFRLDYSAEPASLLVNGEERLLELMLLELLSNAGRAAGREGCVSLKLERRGGRAVLTLTNGGGQGVDRPLADLLSGGGEERLPRPGEGAGLGLFLAQRVIALHQGTMVMERRGEHGLTVTVSLPSEPGSAPLPVRASRMEYGGGLSVPLVELSELLSVSLYAPSELEW